MILLDTTLIKGSHGSIHQPSQFHPILITDQKESDSSTIVAPDVYNVIWKHLGY